MYDIGNSKNITTSNKLIHYDLMRVLAYFCVIVIYIGICDDNPTNGAFSIDSSFFLLYSIVARWAVPCFLMVSGVMFLDKNKDIPIKKLYVKHVFRLAVSYAFWSCIYALYNSFYDAGDSFIEKSQVFCELLPVREITYMVYSRYNRDLYDIADCQASYKYA